MRTWPPAERARTSPRCRLLLPSDKSTLAGRLVDVRPLALNLDIDLVRGQLGGWLDQPIEAGLAARAMAISMIKTHLGSGYDVVVPQLLARNDFIEDLENAASETGAEFVEIAPRPSREFVTHWPTTASTGNSPAFWADHRPPTRGIAWVGRADPSER